MKKGVLVELKTDHKKQEIVHGLSNLFNSNEISIKKNSNIEINHFNEENHKERQKKKPIKKIIRSRKLNINIPKQLPPKKPKKDKKQKSKNLYNNYGKSNKEQLNIDLKECCTIGGEINTLPETPEKNAHLQIAKYIKTKLDIDQNLKKESINKKIEVSDNINNKEGNNNIAFTDKGRALENGKVDSNIVKSKNKNEFISGNKGNSFIKKLNFNEPLLQKNVIRKKNPFSFQEIEKDNVNRAQKLNDKSKKEESSLSIFNGFEIIYENSINESDELPENAKDNNFNVYEDDNHNEINIDDIDNLIPKNSNDSNGNINLGLIEDINCNFKNIKSN